MRVRVVFAALAVVVAGCAGLEEATTNLQSMIQDIDVQDALAGLTDCDRLEETFLSLIGNAVENVDRIDSQANAEVSGSDLRDIVDEVSVSQYYDVARQLGCARVQMELGLVNGLVQMNAGTSSGDALLEQLEEAARSGS